METRLYIELFGGLRVLDGQRVIDRFRTQKTGALLAYLACHPDRMHSREVLGDMLWPDAPSTNAARNNVGVALSSLRAQFEPHGVPSGSVFPNDRHYLGIGPAASTDVQQFEKLLTRAEHARDARERATFLTQAVLLYRGDLLPGMYESWVFPRQEQLAARFVVALNQLAQFQESEGKLEEAIKFAQKALDANILRIAGTETESETMHSVLRLLNAWRQNAVAPRMLTLQGGRVTFDGGPGDVHSVARSVLEKAHSAAASERAVRTITRRRTPGDRHAEPPRSTPPIVPPYPGQNSSARNPFTPSPLPAPAPPAEPPVVVPTLPPAPPLPRPATRFFGREEEQLRLGWLLRTPSTRLVTLVGPGGSGKTRLALEAARELGVPNEQNRGGYPGQYAEEADSSERAIYFLPLGDLADAAHLSAALISAVGLPEDPKAGDPIARMVTTLARTPALLILDNAEHLIDDVTALVRTLLERLPLLTCLVTSRQRLQLPEEVVCTVGALAAPALEGDGAAPTITADPAELVREFPAVALFVDRAQRTRPDFQLTPRNMTSVVRLVVELEGSPLAIELAAARTFLLSPREMVEQIQQHRFDLLKRRGDAPGRHDSYWNTLDWSVRLLPEGTRQLLAHLSIFRGGWSLDAAYRVVGEEIPLDDLALLVDASLVEMRLMPGPDDEEETARYYLLETVREFAREMLSATPADEIEGLSARHAAWLADLTEETEPNLRGARQAFWLDRLMRERDNLRTAFAWCVSSDKASAAVLGLRIFCAGHRFYLVRGVDEGRRHYRAVLAAVNRLPAEERDDMAERLATARNAAGVLALTQGDLTDAREQFTECLALRRQTSDMRGMATVLNNLALVEMEEDHLNEAIAYQTDSLDIWRKLGEDRLVAMVQCNIGVVAMRLDDYARARSLFTESLNYALRTGDVRSATIRRFNLGEAANRSGDYRNAETQFRDCLRDFYTLGDTRSSALCILNLGFVAASRREWRTAARRIGAGLAWCQDNGMQFTPRWQSDLDKNIAAIEEALGIEVGIALRDVRPSNHPTLSEIIAELLPSSGNQSGKAFGDPFRPLSA